MPNEGGLKGWAGDRLMSVLGYSTPVLVKYVIGLAQTCSSSSELVVELVNYGCPSSVDTSSFAQEIFSKVPHKQSGLSSYQQDEKAAAQLARKQSRYKLLDADDDDFGDDQAIRPGKVDAHCKRFRKKSANQESEDDEVIAQREDDRHVRRRRMSKADENNVDLESEVAMLRDQEERVQLERNIRERDAARTRKLMEPKLTKEEEEEMVRRSKAQEQDDTSDLRKISRQVYLQKRRDQKLLEMRDEIIDHEYMFEGVKLTEAEERELRYKKKIYKLAQEHLEDADNINEYKMPEAYDEDGSINQEKRFAAAMQRYRDTGAGDKMNPFVEQEAWEGHQIRWD